MNPNKKRKGFTLVELVIVIAVIAVLSAILIPTFSNVIKNAKIASASSEAKSLSTILMTEAAYSDTAYFSTERVRQIAAENQVSLVSNVDGYSYWYDASTNKVTFEETDKVLNQSQSETITGQTDTGALYMKRSPTSVKEYPFEPETLVKGKPNLRYIELSDNAINRTIAAIRNVSGGQSASQIDQSIADAASNLSYQLVEHFSKFKTSSCVYFTADGVIKGSGNQFVCAVIPNNTVSLPRLSEDLNITIKNTVSLPISVQIIEEGAFRGVTANVVATTAVVLEGDTGLLGESSLTTPGKASLIEISGKDIYKYITMDFSKGVWAYYKNGKEVVFNGDIANSTINDFDYAYKMPQVTLKGGADNDNFFDNLEKLTVRSKLVSGGLEYIMVAVDSDYNVYKISGIGIMTEIGVSSPDYTKINNNEQISADNCGTVTSRKLSVKIPDKVENFINISDYNIEFFYKTGKAIYTTEASGWGNMVKRLSAPTAWSKIESTSKTISQLKNDRFIDVSVSGGNVESVGFSVYEIALHKIVITEGESSQAPIFVRHY